MENHTHFLKLLDFTPAEIQQFLDTAADLKAKKKAGIPHRYLEGKNVALIFEKTSTRTRCAFEVACQDLGMGSTYLGPTGSQIGVKESIADTARVLGRMYDGIEYRGFGQEIVEELANYAGVPVFNGLTNEFHPTQILADFLTIQEHFGRLKGIKGIWGSGWCIWGRPKAYMPDQKLIDTCLRLAAEMEFIEAAVKTDVLYTDVWVSMGEPMEVWQERIAALAPYQVTKALMDNAGPQCRFMHCLPAYHDHKTKVGKEMGEKFGREAMEVTDEVFESPASIVFDEAENRMHTIKAVMYELMK
ncbi:MAG: ornithine carbamoyltransferase [Oscillibacter sp.]|uniref:ornithine carbamoyltransferase n=1 Tax=Oscillibacter sp. TaxID=1945593 RepID=UPI001329B110|nr:ornithine carbamoyltransferase [Oscillibacter sp.]MUU11636.1 ornithine carbamoyltransferase [Oscillibacter sp.]